MFRAITVSLVAAVLAALVLVDHRNQAAPMRLSESPEILDIDAVNGILVGGVRWRDREAPGTLRVYPSDADWTDPTFPSIDGTVSAVADGLRFRPRYPFATGARYRLMWQPSKGNARLHMREFAIPRRAEGSAPTVIGMFPSGDVLPENQLKLYLHFSQPMDRRNPYDHLHLLDAETGAEMEAVFHAMRGGLWDAAGTRLTIVFDPGRVKRGLVNHEKWGPPIVEGRRYRLVVDADWPDAAGRPLATEFTKVFTVTAPDRSRPDPKRWRITTPPSRTRKPVTIDFGEALDHALMQGALRVTNGTDVVVGDATISEDETRWRMVPDIPWSAGTYRLSIDCRLEDLAGNNLIRLFDVDLATDEGGDAESMSCPSEVLFTIAEADQSHPNLEEDK